MAMTSGTRGDRCWTARRSTSRPYGSRFQIRRLMRKLRDQQRGKVKRAAEQSINHANYPGASPTPTARELMLLQG
jgi:hypothetical protein